MSRILALDQNGQPNQWISHDAAIVYHAKNMVAWELGRGEGDVRYRGGENRITGLTSQITTAPIIAVKGATSGRRAHRTPTLSNEALFQRDGNICAYCGRWFKAWDLTRDHVVPRSRGGLDNWHNVVSACGPCNNRKDDYLIDEIGMPLRFQPYAPSLAEFLILDCKSILPVQLEYLKGFIPDHSRLWDRFAAEAAD